MLIIRQFLVILIFYFCLATPALSAERDFTGEYRLTMYGLSRYGTDALTVKNITEDSVSGEVVIDWGIGPQAREPMPWEIRYRIPFQAPGIGSRGFSFRVTVAKRAAYDFKLFFIRDDDDKPLIVGTVVRNSLGGHPPKEPEMFGVLAGK